MSDKDKAIADKAKNYSAEQEAQIVAASPFDLEGAKELGASFDPPKSYRSVIAKALSLKCEYKTKPPPVKKVAAVTKVELVSAISKRLNVPLSGLEKATAKSLVDLLAAIPADELQDVVAAD